MSESSHSLPVSRDRPTMPSDYGVPADADGLLDWSWAEERLAGALNFWFSTTLPGGRPHSVPAWGVWLDGKLYFEGSPETRRMRNIAAQPEMVAHLESASEVVIIEGPAYDIAPPPRQLAERLAKIFNDRYGAGWDYHPQPTQWDKGGLWALTPRQVLAWNVDGFPKSTTRWRFSDAKSD